MVCFKSFFSYSKSLFSWVLILTLTPMISLPVVNAQTPLSEEDTMVNGGENGTENNNSGVTITRPFEQDNLFSMAGGERLQSEATKAIEARNYPLGIQKLQESRQVFNQLSNFHLQLANQFQGINNRIYNARRRSAFEAGQKRDEVTYLLALAHGEAGESPLAIPLLIQVIESQSPSSDLGKQAYQQLYILGFTDIPLASEENNSEENNSEENPNLQTVQNDVFSLAVGENLIAQAQQSLDQQNYEGAIAKLQEARQMLQQLSTLHLRLAETFQGINPDVHEAQRRKAFETGQKRDEITYQMALIHRQQRQTPLAIPLLIQVINSQSPGSELGRQAYQQLYDLGFVDVPFSR
jgi:hypothetical protein